MALPDGVTDSHTLVLELLDGLRADSPDAPSTHAEAKALGQVWMQSEGTELVHSAEQLYTDSKSARDVSYNPELHNRMKHVERRHFDVRDMVERFELEVPYVATSENIADFFTKPMHTSKQLGPRGMRT